MIDPSDCQDGTVLVGTQCVDPGHVTADIEEAPEPNGMGIFGEDSNNPAGTIALKPVGEHFVIHGKIIPFQDADGDGQLDADTDTYLVTVSSPAMLSISADGLHGLAAGFAAVAGVSSTDPLATWERIGINLSGDTSKRQVYLPAAGSYAVVIADTRTLFLSGGAAGAADGADPFEYYVTIDQQTFTPTPLSATNGTVTNTGTLAPGEVKVFTIAGGTGFNSATFDAAAPQISESVVLLNTHGSTTTVKAVAGVDQDTGAPPAASTLGVRAGDTVTVVADSVYNYANSPSDYTLTVKPSDAGALSTSGGTSSANTNATDFTTFFYDVASADEITGMNISFDRPVSGVIFDEGGNLFSYFTYDANALIDPFDITTQSYKGLLREPAPGRYYFALVDPAITGTATGMITATSSYAPLTAVAVTEGTVTPSQTASAYGSNPMTYTVGTDGWQQFAASVSAPSRFFDPTTAYGRLDAFGADADCAVSATTDSCTADATPVWNTTLNATPKGRVVLSDNVTSYLISVRPSADFTLDFERRDHTELDLTAGAALTTGTATLDLTTTVQRYLIKTAATNKLTFTADGNALTKAVIKTVSNTEATLTTSTAAALDAAVTYSTIEGAPGWTAITVTANPAAAAQGFDYSASAVAGTTYTSAAGTTTYDDACVGGTAVALNNADEGVSAAVTAPAGFQLFGFPATSFRVFSNGFLAFETTSCPSVGSSCYYANASFPNTAAPNAVIAPFWQDIVTSSVCTKTSGTKLIVQWVGTPYMSTAVAKFQAILDGADNTVEFVYAADQDASLDGTDATVGLESTGGLAGYTVGFDTSGTVAPGTALKLTPSN